MKIAVDVGHNAPYKDIGAVGVNKIKEDDLTREVGQILIDILMRAGHDVVETAPKSCTDVNLSLKHRCNVANFANADLFVSIHFNSFAGGNAHGAEVYAVSKVGRAIGQSILDEICKLGFYNRGVKRANFHVLANTTMPAILVECCFCNNKRDMKIYDAESMALAIAEGLIGNLPPIEDQPATLEITATTWLKASTEQAENLKPSDKILMKTGFYKILAFLPEEESHYFVRLEDETEGFIFAGHCQVS